MIRHVVQIDTLRGLACLLLVFFHVVGSNAASGLKLDHPHLLRIAVDLLADIRMPLFAFLAGYVYALRPVDGDGYRDFFVGKARRLLIPGAIAITVFALVATASGARPIDHALTWQIYFFSFEHFWFLQAIFFVLVVFALLDQIRVFRSNFTLFCLALMFVYCSSINFTTNLFSLNAVIYLGAYFCIGVIVYRNAAWMAKSPWLVPACVLVAIIGLAFQVASVVQAAPQGMVNRDLQSLLTGGSVCFVLARTVSASRFLALIGSYSLTIYLYHVLGTSGMRRALDSLGVEATALHVVLGMAAGVLVPIALHLTLQRSRIAERYALGLTRKRWTRDAGAWILRPVPQRASG